MKKLLVFLFALGLCVSSFAQTEYIIKFLGRPVDGTYSGMVSHLVGKGFKRMNANTEREYFTGDFNGLKSNIYIHTNSNKVDRVFVCYRDYVDEAQIKINYNKLLSQFKRNEKYLDLDDCQPISDQEDISYEMLVHNKRYDAAFYYKPTLTKEDLETAKLATEGMSEEQVSLYYKYAYQNKVSSAVWFTIVEYGGQYGIGLYYDNWLNQADGEDL